MQGTKHLLLNLTYYIIPDTSEGGSWTLLTWNTVNCRYHLSSHGLGLVTPSKIMPAKEKEDKSQELYLFLSPDLPACAL